MRFGKIGKSYMLDTSVFCHNYQPGRPVAWYLPVVHDIDIILFVNFDQDILVRCTEYGNMQTLQVKAVFVICANSG